MRATEASFAPALGFEPVLVREWPSIPPEDREVAQALAVKVAQMRGADPPSVHQ